MARTLALPLLIAVLLAGAEPGVEIQVVYDNTSANPSFTEDWGFSAVVTAAGQRVLFDSGADAEIFLRNLAQLGIEPPSITHAVISHHHADHRKGIYRLVLRNPAIKVHFLDSFPEDTYEIARAVGMTPIRVTGPRELVPGIYTTGAIDGRIPEQALVVETEGGVVVVTGCSHPGVVKIVETVREQRDVEKIRLLAGGFHLLRQNEEEIQQQIDRLMELGVERIAPMHCSGELAKRLCRRAWGSGYLAGGAGRIITLE